MNVTVDTKTKRFLSRFSFIVDNKVSPSKCGINRALVYDVNFNPV